MNWLGLALALPSFVLADPPARVIVVSFDGAGFVLTSELLAEGKLPNLARMLREGAWSDGMVTSFPTKTAAAHALLFTGRYGHQSGITGNSVLRFPPSRGTRLESVNGYFSESLRVEPVWVMAAKSGVDAYVLHAPQVYPFRPHPGLYVAHGYTGAQSRGEVLAPDRVPAGAPGRDWSIPEARGEEAREIRFEVGASRFRGLFFDDPIDPTEGRDTLGIASETDLAAFVARLKPGDDEPFSFAIAVEVGGRPAWFSLRLFSLDPDGEGFVLYRSGASEMALSAPPDAGSPFPGEGLPALEAFAGNGGTVPYETGALGPRLFEGGTGLAEKRFLETERHLQEQIVSQARLALSRDYGLCVLYSPVTDDVLHQLGGHLFPDLEEHSPVLAENVKPFIVEAFLLQDRFLGVLLEEAKRDAAHLLVVSDHGIAGTDKLVHLNAALHRAGILALRDDGSIDLGRSRALALPLSDASVAVNTTDRPGGIVPVEEREAVLDQVRRALEALVDEATGARIVTRMYEPASSGLLQPGGPTTGDLFLDFAPGYYPSTETGGDSIVTRTEPSGEHLFPPTRREMLAIFAAWGPRIPKGVNLGRVRGIDVTPTILDLLGIEVPPDLPGRSIVPERGILN